MPDRGPSPSIDGGFFRAAFDEATYATIVLDGQGRIVELNRAARDPSGIDLSRLLDSTGPNMNELAALRFRLRTEGRASVELSVPGDQGETRYVSLEAREVADLVLLVVRDVTEQRSAQEELRHLRSLESVGYLTASLVHDFNNLLSAVLGAGVLLRKELQPGTRSFELSGDVVEAAQRATRIARRLLGLARGGYSPETVCPNAVVSEMRGLLGSVVGEKVKIVLALSHDVGPVRVDRGHLEHGLLNLAANARDAMPAGGQLTLTTASVELGEDDERPEGCGPGRYVTLSMTDEGAGMSSEVRERMFKPFFTTKERGSGTGLGLAAVQRFVVESGGGITVRSEPGRGTSVTLYLPGARAEDQGSV